MAHRGYFSQVGLPLHECRPEYDNARGTEYMMKTREDIIYYISIRLVFYLLYVGRTFAMMKSGRQLIVPLWICATRMRVIRSWIPNLLDINARASR